MTTRIRHIVIVPCSKNTRTILQYGSTLAGVSSVARYTDQDALPTRMQLGRLEAVVQFPCYRVVRLPAEERKRLLVGMRGEVGELTPSASSFVWQIRFFRQGFRTYRVCTYVEF